jgi:hypothetical protein
MSELQLPALPPSQMNIEVWDSEVQGLHQANAPYYTADQLRAFYLQGVSDGKEMAAKIIEAFYDGYEPSAAPHKTAMRCARIARGVEPPPYRLRNDETPVE